MPCIPVALAGCVTYPVFVLPIDPDCKLISREMTLETSARCPTNPPNAAPAPGQTRPAVASAA